MGTFCVIGATSWGMTLAWLLDRAGHSVTVVTRTAEEAESLRTTRALERLPTLHISGQVAFASAPDIPACEGLVVAVPAQSVRDSIAGVDSPGAPVLSAAKGIEVGSHLRMSQVIAARWPDVPVAALSGPNLSAEIASGQPAAAVIASRHDNVAASWQDALSGQTFRCYRSPDITGVELAGALKNVIAIAAGVAWGRGLGANAVAALMTRGLAEVTRLGLALGASPETFRGLAGIGDLAATCFSPLSRNRRFGELLASGQSAAAARAAIGEAVEGVATSRAALDLAATAGVELPICSEVAAILDGRTTVVAAIAALMGREPRAE